MEEVLPRLFVIPKRPLACVACHAMRRRIMLVPVEHSMRRMMMMLHQLSNWQMIEDHVWSASKVKIYDTGALLIAINMPRQRPPASPASPVASAKKPATPAVASGRQRRQRRHQQLPRQVAYLISVSVREWESELSWTA